MLTTGKFLTDDLKVFSVKKTDDATVVKTNFMDLLAKNTVVPGMVTADDD